MSFTPNLNLDQIPDGATNVGDDSWMERWRRNQAKIDAAQRPAALAKLYAGLANRVSTPCRLVFAGSSTTAGSSASASSNRYVNILIDAIQKAYPSGLDSEADVVTSTSSDFGTISDAAGVHGYNSGHGGTTAANYLPADEITKIAALAPTAIFHMIGSNDFANGVAPATYKAQIQATIAAFQSEISNPCVHVLIQPYERYETSTHAHAWSEYGEALREIAVADPDNVAFIDISEAYYKIGIPDTDPFGFMNADKVHQANGGHAFMADQLRLALGISKSSAAAAPIDLKVFDQRLVTDTFSRVDGALGNTDSGQAWEVLAGTWDVSGNAIRVVAPPADNRSLAVVDSGESNVSVQYRMGATGLSGIILRAQNVSNHVLVTISGTTIELWERVGGAYSRIGDTESYSFNTNGKTARVEAVDKYYRVYVDGTLVFTREYEGFKSATKHGLRSAATSPTTVGDDFAISKLTAMVNLPQPPPDTTTRSRLTSDGFSGTNGTDVVGRATDVALGGTAKTYVGNAAELVITDGKATKGSGTATWFVGFAETTPNLEAAFTISALPTAGGFYLDLHRASSVGTGSPDSYRLLVQPGGNIQPTKRIGGANQSFASLSCVAGDRLAIRYLNGVVTFKKNGVVIYTLNDSSIPNAGFVGFAAGGGLAGMAIEDFTVDAITV